LNRNIHFTKLIYILSFLIYLSSNIFSQTTDIQITVGDSLAPISPYIYGSNQVLSGDENWAALRQGGNRMTGYNWENNASNAGSDWQHSSDNYLTWASGITNENEPAIVTSTFQNKAIDLGTYSLITLQMAGYVAKDKRGTVTEAQTAPSSRWDEVKFEKGIALSLTPDLTDNYVYMDEYINLLVDNFGLSNSMSGINAYALDNEPALWPSTHPRIHPNQTTCKEVVQKGIELSKIVNKLDPTAEIFGPALYGFAAYTNFQSATDWNTVSMGKGYAWFIDYYLDEMKKAEVSNGKRLLDVLDVHWYPEAQGDHRITESTATTEKDIFARMQAPRTLWDSKYVENSWIGQWGKDHLPLIPKLKASINKYYPGTKLAFTEIYYGGGNHISGCIATADMLGVMAKYGVHSSFLWPLTSQESYTSSAYKIYRNYDGLKSTFGDFYVSSRTSDSVNTSIYSSIKSGTDELHLVAINKDLNNEKPCNFSISLKGSVINGRVWTVDKTSSEIHEITGLSDIQNNSFSYNLPAGSVSHFVLKTSELLAVNESKNNITNFELKSFPNPFNSSCRIEYNNPDHSICDLKIIDITGKVVKSFSQLSHSGYLFWNGTDENNQPVASGIYCVLLKGENQKFLTQKIMLLK
jgi:mannan endo-1,4-beta-mannosidase